MNLSALVPSWLSRKEVRADLRPAATRYFNRSAADAQRLHLKAVNRWRDQLNPLRGLTIQSAVSYLEAGKMGRYADLQWLFDHIEESDPTLIALIERYEGGLLSMDVKFEQVEEAKMPTSVGAAGKKMAEEQAACLREAYDGIDNLREAICFLMLARFRGYSHLEKHINADGDVHHLEPVPQWYWVRDGVNGDWEYNREARSGTYRGEPVPDLRERFIVRERKRPVNKLGLLYYVFRNLGLKDWAGFVETYGIPPLFLIRPPNVPVDKEAEYQAVIEAVIADARGSLPNGSEVKTVESGSRGTNPFRDFLSFLKEELVMAGTGGKLTMLAESGSGTLAGGAHQDAWDDIVGGEAKQISEIFQTQFDAFILEKEFPGQPRLAYFELGVGGEEDDLKEFKRKVWLGFQQDGTVSDIMANLTSIRELTTQVDLPVNEEYDEPYLPVRDDNGAPVVGGTITDAQGDIVGGRSGQDSSGDVTAGDRGQETGPDGRSLSPNQNGRYANRQIILPKLQQNAREELAAAVARDFQPLLKRLEAISKIDDPEILKNRMEAFKTDVDRLRGDITADPESARVIEGLMSAALFSGLTKTKSKSVK